MKFKLIAFFFIILGSIKSQSDSVQKVIERAFGEGKELYSLDSLIKTSDKETKLIGNWSLDTINSIKYNKYNKKVRLKSLHSDYKLTQIKLSKNNRISAFGYPEGKGKLYWTLSKDTLSFWEQKTNKFVKLEVKMKVKELSSQELILSTQFPWQTIILTHRE